MKDKPPERYKRYGSIILLLLLFALLTGAMRAFSFTADEPTHVAAGYIYLDRGAFWMTPMRGHPPLADAWEVIPFYLGEPDIPVDQFEGWERSIGPFENAFSSYIAANVERNEVATRTLTVLSTILLGAVVFRWATDLWGLRSGYVALFLLLWDPIVLGHGSLATNDMAVTAIGTTTLFLVWRLIRRPDRVLLLATGILSGITLVSKGSGILWLAATGGMILYAILKTDSWRNRMDWGIRGVIILVVALSVLWLTYGFEWGPLPGESFPIPAPSHWAGVLRQTAPPTRLNYFLGNISPEGHWLYFPFTFLTKNPLPLLLLICGGAIAALRRLRLPGLLLWNFPFLYVLVAMQGNANIGYRHFLPVQPFFYLLAAQLVIRLKWRGGRVFLALLLLWLSITTISIAPDYISYFTPLLGGPREAWRYLADSNTDWGQAVKALRDFQTERDLAFDFRGRHDPIPMGIYGVDYQTISMAYYDTDLPARSWLYPTPGDYVLSANTLSGFVVAPDNYSWFRYHPPTEVIAGALFYYHVPPLEEELWLAQCTEPTAPLDDEDIADGFGALAPRPVYFDCTNAWVYPNGGQATGWYVVGDQLFSPPTLHERLSLDPPQPDDAFIARHLTGLPVAFRQWQQTYAQPFAMFRRPAGTVSPEGLEPVYPGPVETLPGNLNGDHSITAPVEFDGPLNFLDVAVYSTGETLEVETWWQAKSGPVTRSLSIMAHLITADRQVVGVADGMSVPPVIWKAGDIIVQRHVFPLPPGQDVWLRLGGYWLDTNARWMVTGNEVDALFVPVETP